MGTKRPVGRRFYQEIPVHMGCPFDQEYATAGDPYCEECPFYIETANGFVKCAKKSN